MANYQYITSSGVILPDTSAILGAVQTTYVGAFGSDLVLTPDTPQGLLITAEALAETGVVNNNAAVANQINPNIAGGTFLDAIGFLSGIQRDAQTQTLVTNVTLAGVAGTIIPANSQASTAAGDIFLSANSVTLNGSGLATVNFYSQAYGAIPCASSALVNVVSSVLGWETVLNNPSSSPASTTTLGAATQSDQQFRAYRNNTLGFQGVALPIAITSALYAVPGVTSLRFIENYNSTPAGMLISITGGATLSGEIWGMTTTTGTGINGNIIVDTNPMNFSLSLQNLPGVNPWPIAAYSTTGNISLSGLGTQGGGDWPGSLTAGQIILAKNQTTASQNGLWVAAAGAWTRQAYNAAASQILPSLQGISLIKNSIYTCVAGGSSVNVAAALLENKSSGCAWNGNTTVAVIEPASGQSYNVQYDTPNIVSILITVTTTNGNIANITQAILDYAAGLVQTTDQNGSSGTMPGFVVGADVSPYEIAGAILVENPGTYISNVQISLLFPVSYQATPIAIGQNQQAYTQQSYITVNIA
jgi:hypothetical protein